MLSFRRESVVRDGHVILRNIDLHIDAGERVVILGASGAGKTTLLNEFYQQLGPAAALIPQPHGLVGPLSARQNIALGRIDQQSLYSTLRSLCWMSAQQRSEIQDWAERLELAAQLEQGVTSLSGGQQSRVAIARALYRGGPVVLADEPCAALDPDRARLVLDQLESRFPTLICTMHDVDAGLQLASRVIGIADERIAFDGSPAGLSSEMLAQLYAQQDEVGPERSDTSHLPPIQRPCL